MASFKTTKVGLREIGKQQKKVVVTLGAPAQMAKKFYIMKLSQVIGILKDT